MLCSVASWLWHLAVLEGAFEEAESGEVVSGARCKCGADDGDSWRGWRRRTSYGRAVAGQARRARARSAGERRSHSLSMTAGVEARGDVDWYYYGPQADRLPSLRLGAWEACMRNRRPPHSLQVAPAARFFPPWQSTTGARRRVCRSEQRGPNSVECTQAAIRRPSARSQPSGSARLLGHLQRAAVQLGVRQSHDPEMQREALGTHARSVVRLFVTVLEPFWLPSGC
ncbi:hypothetical protein PSPO01_11418 [Paraphaeosphaeria sporulosa]